MPDAPLLHYSASTAPLQAGSPDNPAANTIDITIASPAGRNIYCNKIEVAVPISKPGDEGAYFTEQPTATIAGKWSPASAQMKTGRELGLASDANYYHFPFNAPPIPGFDLIDEPLKITVSGNLAATPGSVLTCLVTENSGTTSGHYTLKETQELTWDTAEPVFYLHNFMATAPDKPTIPRTKFNSGDHVRFTWESNGTSFKLYDGDGTLVYEGTDTFCVIPKDEDKDYKIVSDTTFTLQASQTSGTQESGYRCATITITINNPTLSDLTVANNLEASDACITGHLEANTTHNTGSFTTDSTLTAGGSATLEGGLTVLDQQQVVMAATAGGINFDQNILANLVHAHSLIVAVTSPGNWAMTADAYSGVRLCEQPTIDDNYQP
ncbi:hypothetical protein [Streptosporangium sp. KLBMP 9127]|nr:hypothetical protein [Streptosporangium sp. KLBMP 9127]